MLKVNNMQIENILLQIYVFKNVEVAKAISKLRIKSI